MARPFWLDLNQVSIRKILMGVWESGQVMQDYLQNGDLFPLEIPFRKAKSPEWRSQLIALQQQVQALKELAANRPLELEWERIQTPVGTQIELSRMTLVGRKAYLHWIGKLSEFEQLTEIADLIRLRFPILAHWLCQNPMKLLTEPKEVWLHLLQVCERFQAQPRPGVFLRELDLPGIDTKFIERYQGLLKQWLDLILDSESVDHSAVLSQSQGFARRYGLRLEEPLIRCRALDSSLRLHPALGDLSFPLGELAKFNPTCNRVWICENLRPFLSFPELPGSWAIFGSGRAVELLRHLPWLAEKELFYWGDLDSHGFAILARLRGYFPQLRSLGMDLPTLEAHSDYWVSEPSPISFELSALNAEEQEAYLALQTLRPGVHLRLEQEKMGQAWLLETLQTFGT